MFSINSKTLFLAYLSVHFPKFGDKNFFPGNPPLSHRTSYEFLATCQNLEKTNNTIPRKCPERKTDGRMDGQTDPIP